ncbi:MAG: DUF1641 domain-containing protein [Kyrpidia tusciae]|nr:DUF1641 domain-containing protein [Kyrpidia tusciae]MBE3551855.1 DUF1641 domain-containing protein [Kyrpidia tusciae]
MGESGQGGVAEVFPDQMLTERLADPHTIDQLTRLLDKLDQVVFLLDVLEDFLRRGPELADSINDMVVLARQSFADAKGTMRWQNVLYAARRIQEFLDSPQVMSLTRSDVMDVRSIRVVGKMARAMIQASEDVSKGGPKRVGLVGLMRALGDPEVQPALNFVISFARNLSREFNHA